MCQFYTGAASSHVHSEGIYASRPWRSIVRKVLYVLLARRTGRASNAIGVTTFSNDNPQSDPKPLPALDVSWLWAYLPSKTDHHSASTVDRDSSLRAARSASERRPGRPYRWNCALLVGHRGEFQGSRGLRNRTEQKKATLTRV